MFLNGEAVDKVDSESTNTPTRAWAIAVGVSLLPIYLIFSFVGMPGKGTVAACALGTLIIVVRMHFKLRNKLWFWSLIALIAMANVFVVIWVPFPNKNFTYSIVAPFGIADYLLTALCIRTVERRMTKKKLSVSAGSTN